MNPASPLYSTFLQLGGRKVVVIGGGTVAERKVRALLGAGAAPHVVAPALTSGLARWAQSDQIIWHACGFEPVMLEGAWLVIAATDDPAVNGQVAAEAERRRVWVNVVDDPVLSTFHVPAVVDRSPITIAISSGGHAPVIARRLRERFESLIDHSIAELGALLAQRRTSIQRAFPDLTQRRRFYEWALDGPATDLLRAGRRVDAESAIDHAIEHPAQWSRHALSVLRVPGEDPSLLTLKGLRALHEADAIMFDPAHHSDLVLSMARRDAERIPVHLSGERVASTMQEAATPAFMDLIRTHGRVVLLLNEQKIAARIGAACDGAKAPDVPPERALPLSTLPLLFGALESAGIPVNHL